MKEGIHMKIKKENLSIHKLNELYLGKHISYRSNLGKIINIAYYTELDNVPYAEIELHMTDCRIETKIVPLAKVVLVVKAA